MFVITNGTSKVTCNACSETLKVENAGSRPRVTRLAVRAAGWVWAGTKVQLCPSHKGKVSEFTSKEKKEKKASSKAAKNGKAPKKAAATSSKKAAIGSNPIKIGQSIGKPAKTAKVTALPTAA